MYCLRLAVFSKSIEAHRILLEKPTSAVTEPDCWWNKLCDEIYQCWGQKKGYVGGNQ